MSEPKGPKLELPGDLADELDEVAANERSDSNLQIDVDVEVEDATAAPAEGAEGEGGDALKEAQDRHLRLAAEFENFKRRTLKERQELLHYAAENLIKELLGTVDNLEAALTHAKEEGSAEATGDAGAKLIEGVELTFRSLMQSLEKSGVKVVEALGEPFDPKLHEAIRQAPSSEHPPGTVIEVYQKGYLLVDRLLRPALVSVASADGKTE